MIFMFNVEWYGYARSLFSLLSFSILKFPTIHSYYLDDEMIKHSVLFKAGCLGLLCLWLHPHFSSRVIEPFLRAGGSQAPQESDQNRADLGFLEDFQGPHWVRIPFNVSSFTWPLLGPRDSAEVACVWSRAESVPLPVLQGAAVTTVWPNRWDCRKYKHLESQQHLHTFKLVIVYILPSLQPAMSWKKQTFVETVL